MVTSNFDDLFQPLRKISHGRDQHFSRNFLKCYRHWGLQIIKIIVISDVSLTLDKAPKDIIHWGEIRWFMGPNVVGEHSSNPSLIFPSEGSTILHKHEFRQIIQSPECWMNLICDHRDALRFLLISHHFLFFLFFCEFHPYFTLKF